MRNRRASKLPLIELRFLIAALLLFTASRDSNGSEENFTFQAGKSVDVRVGNPRPAVVTANLRSQHDTVGELGQPHFEKRRTLV